MRLSNLNEFNGSQISIGLNVYDIEAMKTLDSGDVLLLLSRSDDESLYYVITVLRTVEGFGGRTVLDTSKAYHLISPYHSNKAVALERFNRMIWVGPQSVGAGLSCEIDL